MHQVQQGQGGGNRVTIEKNYGKVDGGDRRARLWRLPCSLAPLAPAKDAMTEHNYSSVGPLGDMHTGILRKRRGLQLFNLSSLIKTVASETTQVGNVVPLVIK